jgi:hypothetical protein
MDKKKERIQQPGRRHYDKPSYIVSDSMVVLDRIKSGEISWQDGMDKIRIMWEDAHFGRRDEDNNLKFMIFFLIETILVKDKVVNHRDQPE